jgi:hypothetical protein
MNFKKQFILFCLLAVVEIPLNNLFSQIVQTKPTRQSSFEAFSQGNYEKAYSQFRELLITYTKDPLYKYYAGVCLVKLNQDPVEAANLLEQAVQETGAVKTLPSDGLFYLGRAHQMAGKFSKATESYKLFTSRVGKKTAKSMGVPELLLQCEQMKGKVADSEIKPAENPVIIKPDTTHTVSQPIFREPVQKPAEAAVGPKVTLPGNYEKVLGEAIEFQFKADSVSDILNTQKKEIEKLTSTERFAFKLRMNENEKLALSFQNKADQKYKEAQSLMVPGQDTSLARKEILSQKQIRAVKDSAVYPSAKTVKPAEKQSDKPLIVIPPTKPPVEVFSVFEVLASPTGNPKAKIIFDPEVPAGLVYRIQIGVFRNPVLPSFFKGLTPVYGFKIAGTDKIIYYIGMFRKSADATKALATVKTKGFKDSFIVALSGNKSISMDRAALLEKEWFNKSLISSDKAQQEMQSDTITPTLAYRVEVIRSPNPLKEDVIEGMRKMAGARGMDIQTLEDGKIAYLIGKFITFDTANEYSDLLKRNGYREATVVAWLGKKEIPVETARQLFDNLK